MFIGNKKVKKIFIDNKKVKKIFIDNKKVWDDGTQPPISDDVYYRYFGNSEAAVLGAKIGSSYIGTISIPSYTTNPDDGKQYKVTSIFTSAFFEYSNLRGIVIPNSVIEIGTYAFYNCSRLSSVSWGSNITSIASGLFQGCSSLKTIYLPVSVTSIGSSAFSGCSSLTSVAIYDGVTSIGSSAFSGCSSLTDVYYYGTKDKWNAISIGSGNESLTEAELHYR